MLRSALALFLGIAVLPATSASAFAQKTLQAAKDRGHLLCGVSQGLAGFSNPDDKGNWSGLDPEKLKTVRDVEEVMEHGYRRLPHQQAEAYAEMFRRLAAGNVPAVIHCTAGKDRTGGGAALILAALGVPRDAIIADFVMTERAVDLTKALAGRKRSAKYDTFAKIDPTVVKAFSSARPGFISAFLDSLDSEYNLTAIAQAHGGTYRAVPVPSAPNVPRPTR